MPDNFATEYANLVSPAIAAVAVTPSDSTDLADTTRALYVGGDGNVSAIMRSGQTVLFTGVKGGVIYPFRVNRVRATRTTATGIVALY